MPNWRTLEAKDRLLAAVIAAHPDKKLLDYRKIATFFGQGTTYDSIEGQFRIIRREAARLREAVENGEHEEAPPRGRAAPVAKSAPKARVTQKSIAGAGVNGGVINGRVNKSISPSKIKRTTSSAFATASGVNPLRLKSPDRNDAPNRVHGIKEENFSTDNSVIEIEDDDDNQTPSYNVLNGLNDNDIARNSIARSSFGASSTAYNSLGVAPISRSSFGSKSANDGIFSDHIFNGDAISDTNNDINDDGDGDGDLDGDPEQDFLNNWTVPFP